MICITFTAFVVVEPVGGIAKIVLFVNIIAFTSPLRDKMKKSQHSDNTFIQAAGKGNTCVFPISLSLHESVLYILLMT